MVRRCVYHEGCDTRPTYNVPGETCGLFCKLHKTDGMIDVKNKRCVHPEGCDTMPNYNVPGETRGLFCKIHKTDDMVNVVSKRCAHPEGCEKQPVYNIPGENQALFCNVHKTDGMVNVKSKRCAHPEGCEKRPGYNVPGENHALFCTVHKNDGMVNVKDKQCSHEGCDTRPTYNVPGETCGLFCKLHKTDGMIDVKNKRCVHPEGCETHPTFNVPGETRGLFCKIHKTDDMVNVTSKRCAHPEGCDTQPAYNVPGDTCRLFCNAHKCNGMVNVTSKRCGHPEGCDTRPTFGIPGHAADRCKQHIESGMISSPKTKCSNPKCKEQALYGIGKPERCEAHKELFHMNLVERRCASCGLLYILNKKGYCYLCDPDEFNRSRLAKQNQIKNMLDAYGFKYESCDRMVDQGECFKYRPDFLFDCGTHFVVLEVDENQHKDKTYACESIRMFNIFQSLGGMATRFIRYNPDGHKVDKYKKRDPNFTKRSDMLRIALRCAIAEIPTCPELTVKYMFFDNRENTAYEVVRV